MPSMLEDVRETLGGEPRRRWMPWRRKSLSKRIENVTEQVGQATGELAEQVGEATGELVERGKEKIAEVGRRSGGRPAMSRRYVLAERRVDLSAERAAAAAEAAADAAERAADVMEYMGSWMSQPIRRGMLAMPAQPLAGPRVQLSPAMLSALTEGELERTPEGAGKRGAGVVKRGAMAIGQRVSELSDGHYGLGLKPEQDKKKPGRRAERRRAQEARQQAREEQPGGKVRWFPWILGLSLGLVIGMIGVAYWQRRRLQQFWGQTSQRAQQVTGGIRQRLEANRSSILQTTSSETPPGTTADTSDITPSGSSRPDTSIDWQVDGRVESTSQ